MRSSTSGKLTDEEWELGQATSIEGACFSRYAGRIKLAMVAASRHHQHDTPGISQVAGTLRRHPFSQIVSGVPAEAFSLAARVYYSVQMPPDNAGSRF
jgi:hypothetical protein